MALTIETGAVIAGANSYTSRADYIAFAAAVGVAIADDDAADVQLVKAFRFINGLESRLKGVRTLKENPNAYPRDDLVIDDYDWLNSEIPRQVILAQQLLGMDINAGIDIYNRPQSASTPVKRVRVEGAVSKEYAVSDALKMHSVTETMAAVNSLLRDGGLGMSVSRG